METTTIISQRTRYSQQRSTKTSAISTVYRPEDKARRYTHAVIIPFLVLVYIFNGSHDPKKVHWLNTMLSALFIGAGIILSPDFLLVGMMFIAIALSNVACVWIVQKFGKNVWSPAVGEILAQLHISVRYPAGR